MVKNINLSIKKLCAPIYRIIEFDRLIEILETKRNCLSRPGIWDDPFESLLKFTSWGDRYKIKNATAETFGKYVFAQCWTFLEENDLMWRVYSPNKDGIRIKSTPTKLMKSFNDCSSIKETILNPKILNTVFQDGKDIEILEKVVPFIGEVEYLSFTEIKEYIKSINSETNLLDLIKSIFIKREPFKNEEEVRIGIYNCNETNYLFDFLCDDRFNYDFDINEIIDEIIFDPRISKQKFNGLKELVIKLGFKNKVERSTIYDEPSRIELFSRGS
jgi:hypothetical protein